MASIPHDLEVMAALTEASAQDWDQLWAAVDAVSKDTDYAREAGGTANGAGEPLQMPYLVYNDAVISLMTAIYAAHLVVPFDWMHWDGERRYPSADSLEVAPVTDAVRVITATIRAERFGEGVLLGSLRNGVLLAALAEVRRWVDR